MSKMPLNLLLGAITAGKIILCFLAWLAWRAHSAGAGASLSRMIGLRGKAVTEVTSEGRVMVLGEYWWARSRTKIDEGEGVKVVGLDGLTLEVEPCPDKSAIPRPVSAVGTRELHEA